MNWKVIGELTDKTVLGRDGLSKRAPRKTSRAIVINDDGLYAVVYAKKFNLHGLPGGGFETGETEVEALKREVLEETGCTCDSIEPLGIISENRYHADYTVQSYYFVVHTHTKNGTPRYTKGEIKLGTSLKWCTFEEVNHLVRDIVHKTNQRKFLQARDIIALDEYKTKYGIQ